LEGGQPFYDCINGGCVSDKVVGGSDIHAASAPFACVNLQMQWVAEAADRLANVRFHMMRVHVNE
jgi:hypothetical protein